VKVLWSVRCPAMLSDTRFINVRLMSAITVSVYTDELFTAEGVLYNVL
jgi:hypothetical protein